MPEIIDPLERAVTRCVPRGFKGRRWGSENQRRGSIWHQRQQRPAQIHQGIGGKGREAGRSGDAAAGDRSAWLRRRFGRGQTAFSYADFATDDPVIQPPGVVVEARRLSQKYSSWMSAPESRWRARQTAAGRAIECRDSRTRPRRMLGYVTRVMANRITRLISCI